MPRLPQLAKQALIPAVRWLNRARLGSSADYFEGTGGIGDDLMCTTVFHELRQRGTRRIVFTSQHPALFQGNPDVDHVVHHPHPRVKRWLREGLPFVRLGYAHYDPQRDSDEPLTEHVLVKICRLAGVAGPIALRPYLFLSAEELAAGRRGENQIVIQTSGLAAPYPMQNKEWFPERFQAVCTCLRTNHTVVQIGAGQDPKLEGAVDLRGQTNLRESAAILAKSSVFIGLEGFLMHLARAVDCRAVIVYGGRLRPWQIGYSANQNLVGDTPCSPCWLRNRCDYDHECTRMISVEAVLTAARAQIALQGHPLEVETAVL